MKIYIVLETDYEWTELKRAFVFKDEAEAYVAGLPKEWKEHYFYPIKELELQ